MRAQNLQVLTAEVQEEHPGVVIYGIGDQAHALQSSDHNRDDTPGVRTPQTDADNIPEYRAIDVMLGPNFTRADGWALVNALLADPECRARITLLIFDGWEWARSTGFRKVRRIRDFHYDHVHVSGRAGDDENTAPWNVYGGNMTSLDTTFTPAESEPDPAPVSLALAIQRIYQALHHGDMTDGYTARTFTHSIFAVLARIEDGMSGAITIDAEALAGHLAPLLAPLITDAITASLAEAVAEELKERLKS